MDGIDNFEKRAINYIKSCELEISYTENAVQHIESEIELLQKRLDVERESLVLAIENLDAYKQSLKQ